MATTGLSINVHVRDDTHFEANKVSDFVTLRIGGDVDVFLFTPEQALALYKAAGDAFIVLHAMQAEREANKELAMAEQEVQGIIDARNRGQALDDWQF